MEGTLLFREDYGGNDPNDPEVITNANEARAAVPGMSADYTPCTSRTSGISIGNMFLVTKYGYQNGNGTSQWHLQDDHTHFGDIKRGYFLEIDGAGDSKAFYSTTIDGLCEGSKLTFSAYVANVMTWGMYMGRPGMYAYPRLKFVLTDPSTDTELATYDTGDIPFDSAYIDDPMCWQQSAEWRLVGMNFTVPAGQNRIKLTIYNNATGATGNDFAIDDIEIHLCAPPVTIDGEQEVCTDEATTLTANFTNDGTFAEPLGYKWWFSADSLNWTELSETTNELSMPAAQKADSGWYKVAVAGLQDIENLNCRATSTPFLLNVKECVDELCVDGTLLFREDFGGNSPDDPDISMESVPGMDRSYHNSGNSLGSGNYTLRKEGWRNGIQWHRQDDHTYFDDKTRGYLLEVDGLGGKVPFYNKTIDGLCAGSKLTFSAYVVNVHYAGQLDYFGSSYVYPRMKFVLKNPETGAVLAEQSTGDIQPDWRYGTPETWQYARDNSLSAEWQLIGMNFTVPEGIESIQMYIYNDVLENGNGNDFALDDIEIHLCAPPVTIEGDEEVCTNAAATLRADFTNDGTFAEPLGYKWWFSADSLTWTELSETTNVLSMSAVQKADSGWYKVAVAGTDNIESVNCRATSAPFLLNVKTCEQPPVQPAEDLCTEGILLFREDFGGNDPNDPRVSQDPVPGMTYEQALTDVWNPNNLSVKAGKYIVTKSGYCNGDTASTNTPNNRRSQWFLQDDHTYPGDYTRGYFMEVDGKEKSDGAVFYTTTIDGLCEGVELSCLAYVANVQMPWYYENQTRVYPRLLFTLLDPADHSVLKTYDTGDIPYDSTYMGMFDYDHSSVWRRVGMTFTVPSGVNAVQLQIANNADGRNGNDFALDDIEVRLCMPPIHIKGVHQVCAGDEVILDTETDYPYMVYEPLYYEWWYSTDNRNWTKTDEGIGHYQLHIPSADASHEGWYKVVMGTEGRMDSEKCHTTSEWFHLKVQECQSPVAEESYNELVCDTLLPMTWHDIVWTAAGTTDFMLTDRNGDDSVHVTLTLDVQTCCPDVQTVELDSIVCGYLLPFTWELEGHFVIFGSPEVQEVRIPHPRWSNCTQTVYSLSLDTVHCDLLYPIIVNKYNWVLLVDNAKVRELFPERTVVGYQWYKDEQPISGATEDDYSETNELHGVFQMYLTLDGGDVIRSNIIDLSHTPEPQSAHVRAYNSSGVLICQWDTSDPAEYPALPAGIYLLRIEQGETCLSRKIIVL